MSRLIRVGDQTPRGYRREDLHDAWSRYLPSENSATSATGETACASCRKPMSCVVVVGQTAHPACEETP